ncbi:deoxyguanosinetriphosphate triphosphohydrolase family protein [Sphingobium sp. YR768]|uniref:deoxyguanosinetriphosphate triphosphohydrolase family protein n=1 Tax=Sphingobium sp. YR768 TaxID=1884365 RepID=UPI00210A0069|nr:dNTP triphosphohydrolase [Sphingobium sp. YR768]
MFQQDYDRLLFSSPVRRLADKTQVWPMDANDGVRTRLTHSHEVANLARSIATRVAAASGGAAFGGQDLFRIVQPIVSAIGLSHDLGNPPFGHQGEVAIGSWFESRRSWIFSHEREGEGANELEHQVPANLITEFVDFDGNPQTLRVMARLQTSHHQVGLDLTAATLAASLKYPVHADARNKDRDHIKKAGYFESERNVVEWVRAQTGLQEGQRHPLTWIMEACDDIAYSVLDVDDILKKGIISPDDVLTVLKHTDGVRDLDSVAKLEKKFVEVNDSPRRAEIRRDIKEQYVRAYMMKALIDDAGDTFSRNADAIKAYEFETPLMQGNGLCDVMKDIAKKYAFANPAVLRSEAIGAAAIDGLMTIFWSAIQNRKKPEDLMSRRVEARDSYAFSLISPNYLEVACREAKATNGDGRVRRYHELRLLTDMISGMTDGFAINTWQKLSDVPTINRA